MDTKLSVKRSGDLYYLYIHNICWITLYEHLILLSVASVAVYFKLRFFRSWHVLKCFNSLFVFGSDLVALTLRLLVQSIITLLIALFRLLHLLTHVLFYVGFVINEFWNWQGTRIGISSNSVPKLIYQEGLMWSIITFLVLVMRFKK